jgi:hypothetical protein
MRIEGEPRFMVQVWGDWDTVVRALQKWFDKIENQKPNDEDDANWASYNIEFTKARDAVNVIESAEDAGLYCNLAVNFFDRESGVSVWAATGNGFDHMSRDKSKNKPACTVRFNDFDAKRKESVEQAIKILQGVK